MSKKKFKILYPKDHFDPKKQGQPFKPESGSMIVMNNGGVFFLVSGIGDYYMGMSKLSDVLPKYDVVWN
jgi:hypothetical protein